MDAQFWHTNNDVFNYKQKEIKIVSSIFTPYISNTKPKGPSKTCIALKVKRNNIQMQSFVAK